MEGIDYTIPTEGSMRSDVLLYIVVLQYTFYVDRGGIYLLGKSRA